jgi:hypothetical protein
VSRPRLAPAVSPACAAFDAEGFVEIGLKFLEEATGGEEHAAGPGAGGNLRVAEVEFVAGSRDRHVEEAAFFFDIASFNGAPTREKAIGAADDKYDVKFEALGWTVVSLMASASAST